MDKLEQIEAAIARVGETGNAAYSGGGLTEAEHARLELDHELAVLDFAKHWRPVGELLTELRERRADGDRLTARVAELERDLQADSPRAQRSSYLGKLNRIMMRLGCTHIDEVEQCVEKVLALAGTVQKGSTPMSEQPKSTGERWRTGTVGCCCIYKGDRQIAITVDRNDEQAENDAAEIVLNAEKARLFDLLAERGWHLERDEDIWMCCWSSSNITSESDPIEGYHEIQDIAGKGKTPLAAVQNAEKRLKGGA